MTADEHIKEHLCSKVRVFLTEVAEGVSNYRSMHNLTEQVEHQYHGRFLIELIQNAHDALEARFDEKLKHAFDNGRQVFFRNSHQ